MVTADYNPVNINNASAHQIAAALKGVGLKRPELLWLTVRPTVHLNPLIR